MATFAPPNPSSSAMARPMPLPAPVTTATAPSRLPTTDPPSHASPIHTHQSFLSLSLLISWCQFHADGSQGIPRICYIRLLLARRVGVKHVPHARNLSSRRRV